MLKILSLEIKMQFLGKYDKCLVWKWFQIVARVVACAQLCLNHITKVKSKKTCRAKGFRGKILATGYKSKYILVSIISNFWNIHTKDFLTLDTLTLIKRLNTIFFSWRNEVSVLLNQSYVSMKHKFTIPVIFFSLQTDLSICYAVCQFTNALLLVLQICLFSSFRFFFSRNISYQQHNQRCKSSHSNVLFTPNS